MGGLEGEGRGGRRKAVLIAGPTASGKSALALALAEAFVRRGSAPAIVNADAMQVYAGLRVLTARPIAEDEAAARHALYGHVDPVESYSVARWLEEVAPLLAETGPAIVVGGTGLYFSALTQGLSDIPYVPADVRAYWRERAVKAGASALHAELVRRDPEMAARLRPSDPQRLARALEVLDATGQSLLAWQGRRSRPLVGPDSPRIVLAPDRVWLHERISRRLDGMVEEGALYEATALVARDLPGDRPALKALGVRALAEAAQGTMPLARALELTARDTRRLAKRQETWFHNQLGDWPRAAPDLETADAITARLLASWHAAGSESPPKTS